MNREELLQYQEHLKQDEKNNSDSFCFYWLAGICSAAMAIFFSIRIFYPLCPTFWFLAGMHKQKAINTKEELSNVQSLIKEKEPCHDD